MSKSWSTPAEYRYRAEALRAIAELSVNPAHRQILMKCADDYDRMANAADLVQAVQTDTNGKKPN